jgi:hypothetical protein
MLGSLTMTRASDRSGKNLSRPRAGALLAGVISAAVLATSPARAESPPSHPRVLAAGDIAVCKTEDLFERTGDFLARMVGLSPDYGPQQPTGAQATAELLASEPGLILPLGDLAYPDGALEDFVRCYEPTWGKFSWRTRPVPGNHEYKTPDAAGYFTYWGRQAGPAGKGYYSYDYGEWFVLALNSEIDVSAGAEQLAWLRRELAQTDKRCILAYYHRPRFASGEHGRSLRMAALFQTLYDYGVSVVLNGHEHHYERLRPVDPDGEYAPLRGIRHFIVGTGGAGTRPVHGSHITEVIDGDAWGLLRLELRPTSYAWEYLPTEADGLSDSGEAGCVDREGFDLIGKQKFAADEPPSTAVD